MQKYSTASELSVHTRVRYLMISKEPVLCSCINYTFNFLWYFFTFSQYLISTNYWILRVDVCEEWGDPELRTAHTAGRYIGYSYYPPADLSFSSFVTIVDFYKCACKWKIGICVCTFCCLTVQYPAVISLTARHAIRKFEVRLFSHAALTGWFF